ncbi:MAG: hypothetical protein AAB547_02705 [Patescibacteria group bacterium]
MKINTNSSVALAVVVATLAIGALASRQVQNDDVVTNVAIGHGLYSAMSWVYDNPVYISVIYGFGPVEGGLYMTAGSAVICLLFLVYYRRKRVPWMGWDAVDMLAEKRARYKEKYLAWASDGIFRRIASLVFLIPAVMLFAIMWFMSRFKKAGNILGFLVLCIIEDPFIATAFARRNRVGDGLTGKDWGVFGLSIILSNGYWVARTVVVIEAVKYLGIA